VNVTIDRFEGEFAVCEKENRQMIDIEKSKLPETAKEGDVLNIKNDIITIDFETTKKRKKEIEKLTENFWN
jgi:hypothetical protein